MAGNRTLTIIKPDAFGAGKAGKIIALLEERGFRIRASRVLRLTQAQASSSSDMASGAWSPGWRA